MLVTSVLEVLSSKYEFVGQYHRETRWILGLSTVLLAASLLPDSRRVTIRGTNYTTTGPTLNSDTPAAINQDAYNRLRDLAVAGDNSGITELMLAGLVFSVPEGTQIRIIDRGLFTTEIKVESGPHAGRYFIVATDAIATCAPAGSGIRAICLPSPAGRR